MINKGIRYFINIIFIFIVDSWSQYNNPEEGTEREGDIHYSKSRKTITTENILLWPNGIVNYYVHSSIGKSFLQF